MSPFHSNFDLCTCRVDAKKNSDGDDGDKNSTEENVQDDNADNNKIKVYLNL